MMQDASDECLNMEDASSRGYVEISTAAAILFAVVASCFLVIFYKLVARWFVEVLVVLLCVGAVSYLTLAVTPFGLGSLSTGQFCLDWSRCYWYCIDNNSSSDCPNTQSQGDD
ncbi:hypothetical protein L6164_002349 [Bauhinia variegata]|uniref:Uncharacterized protein n=1 Tax=Bauhinia variegata TaxID=167791 RepID=A0ACB9PXE4_BAUVA|nr:hypothetical protein L6164_002349 [Bauhinia variegata]